MTTLSNLLGATFVGDQGPAATIEVGTVTTGDPGSQASVVNAGTTGAAILNFTLPRGSLGYTGSRGAVATIAVGSVNVVDHVEETSVTNSGTSTDAILNFNIPRGVISYNFVSTLTNYTAAGGDYIFADTSQGAFTITLPANPLNNTMVVIADRGASFATNNVTINRNGSTIEDTASNVTLTVTNSEYMFAYTGTTWRIYSSFRASGATPHPRLVGVATANEGSTIQVTIENYQTSGLYTVSVSGGTYSRTGSSISWTLPNVASNTTHTLTASYANSTGTITASHLVSVVNISYALDAQVSITNFSTSTYNNFWS